MSRIRLLRTASFRLATIYLALFTASALALGAFVYLTIRHEILADFDERIVEETDALQSAFAAGGRERLAEMLETRGSSGGGFAYGLESPDGRLIAGDLGAPVASAAGAEGGWIEAQEAESDEPPDAKPEIVRALVTRLSDGSTLIVGDERRRSDEILRGVLSAFGWAVAATVALGTAGGLWLSAQFLGRIDSMRLTAQRLMAGDWSRRIPLSRTDDDLTALARTFNRLFDRIEKLLQANKQAEAHAPRMRIMKKYGRPRKFVTDGLRAYSAAMREVGNADRQEPPLRIAVHVRDPLLADLGGEHRAKPVPPKPDRLMADVDPALGQEILDVVVATAGISRTSSRQDG